MQTAAELWSVDANAHALARLPDGYDAGMQMDLGVLLAAAAGGAPVTRRTSDRPWPLRSRGSGASGSAAFASRRPATAARGSPTSSLTSIRPTCWSCFDHVRVRAARQLDRDKRDVTETEQIADILRIGMVTRTRLETTPYVELRRTSDEFDQIRRDAPGSRFGSAEVRNPPALPFPSNGPCCGMQL